MAISPRAIALAALGALAFVLFAITTVISAVSQAPGDASIQAQQGDPEHRLFAPGLVAEAEGTYAAYATATPSPTPVGVQDAPNRYFVAIDGDDDNDGTREAPFASVSFAVDATEQVENREIYVQSGRYTGGIVVRTPLELHGGYDSGTWERSPGSYSRIRDTAGPALGIISAADVTISGFEFYSREFGGLGAPDSLSRIAVSVEYSENVVFRDNRIVAGHADDGVDGKDGVSGANGQAGGSGTSEGFCVPPSVGGAGGGGGTAGGPGGTGGLAGGFAGTNGQNASASVVGGSGGAGGGAFGGSGSNGGNGAHATATLTHGAGGDSTTLIVAGIFAPTLWAGYDGASSDRLSGAGGGGGGGGGGSVIFPFCGAGGGGGGGGGFPAVSNGQGGQAGGASIGILLFASEVFISDTLIATGNGGDGGAGGSGGAGGAGGPGGPSGSGAGGAGGVGGYGAGSAAGGGGAGGPSVGILANTSSSLEYEGVVFELGSGGTGGSGGHGSPLGSDGTDGIRAEQYSSGL
jgi:hypothetical protein